MFRCNETRDSQNNSHASQQKNLRV